MLEAHALCNLVRGLLVNELSEQFISIREGGCRALTSGDIAIDGDKGTGIRGACLFQGLLKARITGSTPS
jgi:hypothetical protein